MTGTPETLDRMRRSVARFCDDLAELPPDARMLAVCEAAALMIAASYASDQVPDVTAHVIEALPQLVARYEVTVAADKADLIAAPTREVTP